MIEDPDDYNSIIMLPIQDWTRRIPSFPTVEPIIKALEWWDVQRYCYMEWNQGRYCWISDCLWCLTPDVVSDLQSYSNHQEIFAALHALHRRHHQENIIPTDLWTALFWYDMRQNRVTKLKCSCHTDDPRVFMFA